MEYTSYSQNDEYPEAWTPAPGDTVEGVVTNIVTIKGKYGEYPCVELDTANGPVSVHCARAALKKEVVALVEKHGMKVGDQFGAHYVGEQKTKDDARTFHMYNVAWTAAPTGTMTATATPATAPAGYVQVPAGTVIPNADNGPDF